MRKLLIFGFIGLLVFAGLLFTRKTTAAQKDLSMPVDQSGPAGSTSIDPSSPDGLTSFTVSNPYCYQPDPSVDQCSINLRYIQANGNQTSSPYLTWLTISISSKNRFSASAFFEGAITYSYSMIPDGFKVPCGAPNEGGAGNQYGLVYGVVITPLDSARNPMSTDTANVTCPAYVP